MVRNPIWHVPATNLLFYNQINVFYTLFRVKSQLILGDVSGLNHERGGYAGVVLGSIRLRPLMAEAQDEWASVEGKPSVVDFHWHFGAINANHGAFHDAFGVRHALFEHQEIQLVAAQNL